jgi:hypothetical protein
MRLPNGHRARIDVAAKLIGYCLNKSHPTGRHKARVFESVLGVTADNADILAQALRDAATNSEARIKDISDEATKYEIELTVEGPRGIATVRSGWILEQGSQIPRLTTCYIVRRSSRGSRDRHTQTS